MRKSVSYLVPQLFLAFFLSLQATPQAVKNLNSTSPSQESVSRQFIDSLLKVAVLKTETDYTIPSYTILKRAIVTATADSVTDKATPLLNAVSKLQPREMPYSIVININEDPATGMAFNWFTNAGVTGGKVEVVKGVAHDNRAFENPFRTVNAKTDPVNDLNYSVSGNGLQKLAAIPDSTKRSYMSNKAIVVGLKPDRTYSFRVGKEGSWSDIGTFKTAVKKNSDFSFIYTTDPQANTDAMFDISRKTTSAARRLYPDARFWVNCGDLVQTSGDWNSEWEWEQVFMTQQDMFLNIPFAPVLGNHDKSLNRNFTSHFNTDSTAFDFAMSASPGSVYSFVYGNALFLAISFEDYREPGYLEALAKWMRDEVNKHPEVKWKIAFYHKTIYTGSTGHLRSTDSKTVRDRIAPLIDSLKIDLALQGHDHIYEVIGPVKDKQLVPGAVKNQTTVPVHPRENLTGLLNGVFDVSEGTIYFLNNSSGKKKYEPTDKARMDADEAALGINNYFGLFTGRFGQTGRPTFSNVRVAGDTITVATYEVNDEGVATLFDEFKLVK